MFWKSKRRTDTVQFRVVKHVGGLRVTYELTVPDTFTADQIEELLAVVGAIEPRTEVSGTAAAWPN